MQALIYSRRSWVNTCAALPAAGGLDGLIANGAVRDVAALAAWADFPVFALGRIARGPVSIERGAVNGNVVCGGMPVTP